MQFGAFILFIFHSKSASLSRNVRKITPVSDVFSTTMSQFDRAGVTKNFDKIKMRAPRAIVGLLSIGRAGGPPRLRGGRARARARALSTRKIRFSLLRELRASVA